MTHEQAVAYVEQMAVKQIGKPIAEMNEEEKDAVSVVLQSNNSELYLIGKIEAFDENQPHVFFYVESDENGQSDNIATYEEAYACYQTYLSKIAS